ncbi:protein-L-isoaspartate O-methyltransferase [mine drainage metagenome]|uniref:protein-L-isoaspartate(D-aspartate) O-methyltransferase n=1 Tax=mine drainage metagenome TaxID=410659 RepID=A0A1J5Q165_9ZZZZ
MIDSHKHAPKIRPGFPARLDAARALPVLPLTMRKTAVVPRQAPVGLGMDSSVVRQNMVAKLAQQGIADRHVLSAMEAVQRHLFVDSALVNQAYEDTSLPIGLGQTISKPGVVSRMLELLRQGSASPLGRVLEIGTGCGYQAAVLSQLCTEVYSIERLRALHDKARNNLRHLRLANVHLLFGDGMQGYVKGAPYAGIIAAAGGQSIPACWLDQLAIGGRLVAPVAASTHGCGHQALVVIDKTVHGLRQTVMEAVHFVPLKSGIA